MNFQKFSTEYVEHVNFLVTPLVSEVREIWRINQHVIFFVENPAFFQQILVPKEGS